MTQQAARLIMVKDDQLLVMHRNKFGREYYTLIGGGIEPGETPEEAIKREVKEETTLDISDPKLVYIEEAGEPFGRQYVFQAEHRDGKVMLSPESDESQLNLLKQNMYTPMWLEIKELPYVPFLSTELKDRLIHDLAEGFSDQVIKFTSNAEYEDKVQLSRRKNG